ncbi:Uncharacterised protein [uncultured archaeon]|nr:Uncharacterised protein [uncultured archaeon]
MIANFAGILAFIIIVYAGMTWVESGADPGKRKKAQDMVINAVLGLALMISIPTVIFGMGLVPCDLTTGLPWGA